MRRQRTSRSLALSVVFFLTAAALAFQAIAANARTSAMRQHSSFGAALKLGKIRGLRRPLTADGGGPAQFGSVTCISATECWAVGNYSDGTNELPLFSRWDGTRWLYVASSGIPNAHLQAITCLSSSDCWAVGYAFNYLSNRNETFIEHWNGSSWSPVSSP